jgi:hypothetical protein
MSLSPRLAKSVSGSIHRQLNLYALAATAAGCVLVHPPAADASIVYTPADIVLDHGRLAIDLNHDGVVDFVLLNKFRHTGENTNMFELYANPAHTGNGVEGKIFRSVFALTYGSEIGSGEAFSGRFMASFCSFNGSTVICLGGNWLDVSDRYLGLKFTIDGKTHYGWARLNVTYGVGTGLSATLTGYAYETVPGKAIVAGATKGPDDERASSTLDQPIREATLGRLALGAPFSKF